MPLLHHHQNTTSTNSKPLYPTLFGKADPVTLPLTQQPSYAPMGASISLMLMWKSASEQQKS
jgi:hypothetical protein